MSWLRSDAFGNVLTLLVVVALLVPIVRARRSPLWREAYRRLGQNKLALAALAVLGLYSTIAVLDSIGWQDSKISDRKTVIDRLFEREPERTYSPPFGRTTVGEIEPRPLNEPGTHWLGTDGVGNDVLYRTLKGVRTAFVIGGFTMLIALPIALTLGLLAGYLGKRVDDAVQYLYSVLASVPDVLLLIATILVLGRSLWAICIALGITSWVRICRLVRGETLKHREREYVRAAQALGAGTGRILFRHVLPNLLPAVIVSATLSFSSLVLAEAILSYLGVGVDAEMGSWGNMIDSARDELTREPLVWWNLVAASAALFGLVLALNLFADALRDAIDPRLRSS